MPRACAPPAGVVAGWVDQDTDPEARDLGSGWAAVEEQAAQELGAAEPAEPAGAVALARQEVAEGAPTCGSQVGQAVAAARDQEPVVQVVESERVVARVAVDMAAVPGLALVGLVLEVEPAAALVAGRAEVDLGVVGAEGPGWGGGEERGERTGRR